MDLSLGWLHPVWVDEVIPRSPRTQNRLPPMQPKLTWFIIDETIVDEFSGAQKFRATASSKAEEEEEALKDLYQSREVFISSFL